MVLQFGKAEQDAFILDFNPMGEWGLSCGGSACCGSLWFACKDILATRHRGGRCWPLGRCIAWAPAAARMHFPPVPPHLVPTPDLTRRLLRPAPPGSPAAVLTASQAFGIVLSTFDSKLFL